MATVRWCWAELHSWILVRFRSRIFRVQGEKRTVSFGRLFRHLVLARNQPKGDLDQVGGQGSFEERQGN